LILVGFGTSRAELTQKYAVTLGPSESIAGVKTTRIDLKPKSKQEEEFFKVIQLWIPEDKANPIQEKILKGNDYNLLQFSNLKIPAPAGTSFDLKLPPDVKAIKAGK
jgi:hypothetical protein